MKVLIISHNPITAQSNMGKTFLTLFSSFAKDELCQIYIYPTIPNQSKCGSYYRMTDKDMLGWLLKRKKIGRVISQEQVCEEAGIFEVPQDEALYRNPSNKSPIRRILRDLVWKLAKWKNAQLNGWLEQEKPDCIFVAPGVACFLYDIALYVSKRLNIPIVTYICDEYFFVKKPRVGLDRLRLDVLHNRMRKLLGQTARLVVISEELRAAYENYFGVPTTVLMTGSGFPVAQQVKVIQQPTEICYFGNIRCNRYRSLVEIGHELDQINQATGSNFKLKIYSAEKNEAILSSFKEITSIELGGFVSGAAFDEAFRNSQLLLHVEAFDEASMDFVKHSVSTKIADCLASGIPLLAYAPESVSSMQHLLRQQCALTATSKAELREMLLTAFSDHTKREQVVSNALAAARRFHDLDRVGAEMYDMMEKISSRETRE